MDMRLDAWSIGAMLLVLGLAVYGIRLLRQRVEEQRYQEQLAELQFEQTLFSNSGSAGHESEDLVFLQNQNAAIFSEAVASNNPPPIVISPALVENAESSVPADIAADAIIRQLKLSGLLGSIEGYLDLHGNRKGAAILSLRNGKRALLVPHMESEAFFRRHASRVDVIIVMGSDGKGLVVTPLEEMLSDNISLS